MSTCFEHQVTGGAEAIAFVLNGERHEFHPGPFQAGEGLCFDPFSSLARVAVQLAAGGRLFHSTALFDCDVWGYLEVSFINTDPTNVRLARFPSDARPNGFINQGETLAQADVDSLWLALDISRALDAALRASGVLGFGMEFCERRFPVYEYLQLRRLLDLSPAAEALISATENEAFNAEVRVLSAAPCWSPVRLAERIERVVRK